ncbi:MAG: ethanolamine ammonia-lyase light chain EutC [Desulfamplus sp.]|nr:ethanolamine ammonia-lyase light chain EutC [Desulfamplus sp.]
MSFVARLQKRNWEIRIKGISISNIRQGGLQYIEAAGQLESLISAALKQGLPGVHLKDNHRLNSLE